MRNGILLKIQVSDICIKRISVNQGFGVVGKTELSSSPCTTFKCLRFQLNSSLLKAWPIPGHKNHLIKSKELKNSTEQKITKLGTMVIQIKTFWITAQTSMYICKTTRESELGPQIKQTSKKVKVSSQLSYKLTKVTTISFFPGAPPGSLNNHNTA